MSELLMSWLMDEKEPPLPPLIEPFRGILLSTLQPLIEKQAETALKSLDQLLAPEKEEKKGLWC